MVNPYILSPPPGQASHRTSRRGAVAKLTALAAFLTITLTVAGCTSNKPGGITGASPVDLAQQLKTRPSYEDGAKNYLAMLDEIRAALTELAPDLRWRTQQAKEFDYGFCAPPFADVPDAQSGNFDAGDAVGSIPDDVWPQAKQAVVAIAARYGFTQAQTLKDKPGDHMIVVRDKWNASLELGSVRDTTLVVFGTCLLRSEPASTATS